MSCCERMFSSDGPFLEVAKHYYNKNFGTMSKSELDLLMFKILYEKLRDGNDSSLLSDVSLAFMLGITKQRVKMLKEKMLLKYYNDEDVDWKSWFRAVVSSRSSMEYDSRTGRFSILVQDPRIKYLIEDELESNGFVSDYSFNSKLMVLSRRAFVSLAYGSCDDEDLRKKLEKCLAEASKEEEKNVRAQLRTKTFWDRFRNLITDEVFGGILGVLGFVV